MGRPPEEATLEQLLERGEVTSALLLNGDFTAEEVRLMQLAYETGIKHGRAAAGGKTETP